MNVPAKISGRPAARSAEEWRGIVEDFEREGTTAAAYCEGRRMTPKTLLCRHRRFATLLADLGTLTRNEAAMPASPGHVSAVLARPTPLQERACQLLEIDPAK